MSPSKPCDGQRRETCRKYADSLSEGLELCSGCGVHVEQALTRIIDKRIADLAYAVDKKSDEDFHGLFVDELVGLVEQIEGIDTATQAHYLITVRLLQKTHDYERKIKHAAIVNANT